MMSEAASPLAPLRKDVVVPLDPASAFELFTARFGATLVTLTHSGWERRADGGRGRLGYDSGWPPALAAFRAAAVR